MTQKESNLLNVNIGNFEGREIYLINCKEMEDFFNSRYNIRC